MTNFNVMSVYDLNCLMAIALGSSEKWINKHSDLVPDYCNSGKSRAVVVDTLTKLEEIKASVKHNDNQWGEK